MNPLILPRNQRIRALTYLARPSLFGFHSETLMTFNFEKSKSYLVCPKCHSDLVPDGASLVCTNPDVRLRYPILEDIPRLLVEEAEELTPEAWAAAMQRAGRRDN